MNRSSTHQVTKHLEPRRKPVRTRPLDTFPSSKAREAREDCDKCMRHITEALKYLAAKKCDRRNCGSVCLCPPCHARAALTVIDPDWRP